MAKELKWGKGRQATKLPSQKGVRCQCQCQAHKGTHYGHLTARYAAKGKRTKPSGKEGWPLAAYAQYFVQTCSTEVVSGDRGMCGVRGEGQGQWEDKYAMSVTAAPFGCSYAALHINQMGRKKLLCIFYTERKRTQSRSSAKQKLF